MIEGILVTVALLGFGYLVYTRYKKAKSKPNSRTPMPGPGNDSDSIG